jgi:hypothetical protein
MLNGECERERESGNKRETIIINGKGIDDRE